jgi:hypothetical protein
MTPQIDKYISDAPDDQRKIMERLRQMIHEEVPEVSESIKWSRPVFSTSHDFAYFKTAKSYLTLGFFHFDKITQSIDLLEGTGKDMRHIKIKSFEKLPADIIRVWIRQVTQ